MGGDGDVEACPKCEFNAKPNIAKTSSPRHAKLPTQAVESEDQWGLLKVTRDRTRTPTLHWPCKL